MRWLIFRFALMNASRSALAAHSLRGSSATLGASKLADLCNVLKEAAAKGILEDANDLLAKVTSQTAEVRKR
jgi:HPt (histidine-containing phosphotransfer) domain-containing protein